MSEIPTGDWSWVHAAAERFERAWKKGPRPRIEHFLAEVDEPRWAPLLEELIRVETELLRRAGEPSSAEEYRRRFPKCVRTVEAVFGTRPSRSAARDSASILESTVTAASSGPVVPNPLPVELANHADYEIIRELGRGGMGVVYLAHNRIMDRDEVLKVMGHDIVDHPGVLDRFLREIRAVAKLRHPNIVSAYSAFRCGGNLVFAMEYVVGLDLRRMVKACGPMPVAHACFFVNKAALGLQHAHEEGMVHRDIKPGNLMLSHKGNRAVIKLLDFGLSKATSEQDASELQIGESTLQMDFGEHLTRTGEMLGTPDFIAPEQIAASQKADIRADIYSLGCTLYFLLSGRPPFPSPTPYDALKAHQSTEATLLDKVRPAVPAELAALVARMMAKDPARRFQEPAEVAEALTPFFKTRGASFKTAEVGGLPPGTNAGLAPGELTQPATDALGFLRAVTAGTVPATSAPGADWSNLVEFKDTEDDDEVAAPSKSPLGVLRRFWPVLAGVIGLAAVFIGFIAYRVPTDTGKRVIPEQKPMPRDPAVVGAKDVGECLALGRANARIGDWDKVAADFARALELLPYDASDGDASVFGRERVGICVELADYDDAFARAVRLRPTDGQLWLGRGRRHAREGLWAKAASDYAEAVKLLPDDHSAWNQYEVLLLQAGDQEGYRQARQTALQRFKTTGNGSIAHRVAMIALLRPLASDDLKLTMQLAEQSVQDRPEDGWHLLTLALAQLRAGQSMEAKKSLLKAADSGQYRDSDAARVSIELLSAMTDHRLGENEEARRHLGKAKEEMDSKLPGRGGKDMSEYWQDRIPCQQLLGEAEELLKGGAPAGEPIAKKTAATTKQGTEVTVAAASATGPESKTTPGSTSPAASATPRKDKDGSIAPAGNVAGSLGAEVQRAITQGVGFLTQEQRSDGSWLDVESGADIERTVRQTGTTSLVTLALMTAGEKPDSPSIRKALDYLRHFGPGELHSTYAISFQTMVFAAAEPRRDQLRIAANTKWLEQAQIKPSDAAVWPGSWTYDDRKGHQGDNSNSQFALLGLHAASEAGVPVRPEVWALARRYWETIQKVDGSWAYRYGERTQQEDGSWTFTPDPGGPTASMTCAGLSSLMLSGLRRYQGQEFLQGETVKNCGKGSVNRSVQRGIDWLANHFQVGQNFGGGQQWRFYYLYGLERAARLAGIRFFGPHDWYRLGAEQLVHEQNKFSGFWRGASVEQDRVLATSFALLFLARGRAPVLINKLRHGPSSDWQNDPDDVRNLVGIVSRDWNNPMTWQIVDPGVASVSELLEAPIIFFNGHRAPEFNAIAKQNLRELIEKGGFIFADACCSSAEFDAGFKDLMKEILPGEQFKLRPLTADHPVWRGKHLLAPTSFELWGIQRGAKTVVIYSTQDLSCFWNQAESSPANPAVIKATRIGQNVIDYFTERKVPPYKLSVR